MARLKANVPNPSEGTVEEKSITRYRMKSGAYLDLSQCTAFIFYEGSYIPIPAAMISSFRPQEQIDAFYSCPHREQLRCVEVE